MKEFWNAVQFVFTAVGGWLGYFLGGCDGLLYALSAFVPIYAPDMEFLHMQRYKTGFRCIMPIENLGTMIPRGRSIWQKHEERQR